MAANTPPKPGAEKGKRKHSIIGRARQEIEKQMRQAANERKKDLMKRRLEYVNKAVAAQVAKKPGEAVFNYRAYLTVVEELKGASPGGLTPTLFDKTKEMGDLLMLAGVYWDLTRLYDRTDSPDKRAEFIGYLEKFLLFTKGFTWQPLCAESLRRYIMSGRTKHPRDFKNAYKLIGKGGCFVVTALSDLTEEQTLENLRSFRDTVLARTWTGRLMIRVYYRVGPVLADLTDIAPLSFRRFLARGADRVARFVERVI